MAKPLRIKRVYEPPAQADGCRVLVDRLWPRGMTREAACLEAWLKDLAPSHGLRKWFGHDADKWEALLDRYREELESRPEARAALSELRALWRARPVTLLYAARDEVHNNAAALARILQEK